MDKNKIVIIASLLISTLILIIMLLAVFYPIQVKDKAISYTANNKDLIGLTEKKWFIVNLRICGVIGVLLSSLIIYLSFCNLINPKINKKSKKIENIK